MKNKLNVMLCGGHEFGCRVFDLLLRNIKVNIKAVNCSVKDRLFLHSRPFPHIEKLTADELPDDVDLIVAAHCHELINQSVLDLTTFGGVGYHPSLLPLHRGKDAIPWAVRDHDRVTGGSVYYLTDVIDGGPVAAQDWCFVRPDDTACSLWRRDLLPMGLRLIEKVVDDISKGIIIKEIQNEDLATYEPPMVKRE